MKKISKGKEPNLYTTFRLSEEACYANLRNPLKTTVKERLLNEQGSICCYCQRKIHSTNMKIEHFLPQNKTSQDLDWKNLFASCKGGDGLSGAEQHCDTSKKDRKLCFDILLLNDKNFNYKHNGEISHSDESIDQDINDILNLNSISLKRSRKATISGIVNGLKIKKSNNKLNVSFITRKLSKLNNKPFEEFVMLREFFYKRWLSRNT